MTQGLLEHMQHLLLKSKSVLHLLGFIEVFVRSFRIGFGFVCRTIELRLSSNLCSCILVISVYSFPGRSGQGAGVGVGMLSRVRVFHVFERYLIHITKFPFHVF